MVSKDIPERYSVPLCPYLTIGNQRILIHMDAYCIAQSLQWPAPGAPDRLALRNGLDEWPYWDELPPEQINLLIPYFEYSDGQRDYLHQAKNISVDYIEDTNILVGSYELPNGATIKITTFVLPDEDVWIYNFQATGTGKFVHQNRLFQTSVRAHPLSNSGRIDFKGGFTAPPRGAYVIVSDHPLKQHLGSVSIPITESYNWTIYISLAEDIQTASNKAQIAMKTGIEILKQKTIHADHIWLSNVKQPNSNHLFITSNYKRWLLGNKLCLTKDGAMLAGPRPFWAFSWPRDSSIIAASFAVAGYPDIAKQVLRWHLDNTPVDGIHHARYHYDRSPVTIDYRDRQGDNPGFLLWATAFISELCWDDEFINSIKDNLFMLADLLVDYRDEGTLFMPPEADWMESIPAETLCIAIASIAGLKGASFIAEKLSRSDLLKKYNDRAVEINDAIFKHLWDEKEKYLITSIKPLNKASDAMACWGIYAIDHWNLEDEKILQAFERIKLDCWDSRTGGLLIGKGTEVESLWFYHTSLFLLAAAKLNDQQIISQILSTLKKNVSPQGLIPEQVGLKTGSLWGCSYLTTANACLLLFAYQ